MKDQLFLLIDLQNYDSKIELLKDQKRRLPLERERLDGELAAFEARVEEAERKVDEVVKLHREREGELKANLDNLQKIKGRLVGVKTNDEYQATLKEIEFIGNKNGTVEDSIIQALEEIDRSKSELEKDKEELTSYRNIYDVKIREIDSDLGSIDSRLEEMAEQVAGIRDGLEGKIAKRYDIIKEKRNGLAVVSAWKEVCGGCHMNIPPQMYNELQLSQKLMLCPHCNRILFWEDRNNGEE